MFIRKFSIILLSLFYSIFLAACGGGGNLLLSSAGTYQVNAYINDYSLDNCSLIRQNDVIRPYFVNSVINDPDIKGLTVFLKNSLGQAVGKKTCYMMPTQKPLNETEIENTVEIPEIPKPEVIIENPVVPESKVITEEAPEPKETETQERVGVESEKIPESSLVSDPSLESEPEKNTEIPETDFPLTITKSEESAKPPLVGPDPPNTAEKVLEDRIISVARLDQNLPSFRLTETLEIGEYFMVFQVLGEKEVLYTLEKQVYFLGNATLTFDDIQRYLPSTSSNDYFLPPGSNILLEAQIVSDKRLDPYIIWYNGGKRMGEGKLFEENNYLIWKVPEQTGFHTVKAEVFPVKPERTSTIKGMVKELSLPVSSKSKNTAYFSKEANRFVHWYQFQSNLLDSKAPTESRRNLRPENNKLPRWVPHEGSGMYGLSIGPEDIFSLPDASFMLSPGEQGLGHLLFRLVPLSDGILFHATFKIPHKTVSSSDTLDMKLSLTNGNLFLTLMIGTVSYTEVIDAGLIEMGNFITPTIHFEIKGDLFTASVNLEGTDREIKPITMGLPAPLTGEGTFQLGAEIDKTHTPVAIFNEIGVIFTKMPLEPDTETKVSVSDKVYGEPIAIQDIASEIF
jgi:hypothetical protein